jgi:regulator of PEP synthase PpsR (kinase-PPPase family)
MDAVPGECPACSCFAILERSGLWRNGIGGERKRGSLADIEAEVRLIDRVMARYGWRRIDVSYMSVEEVAKEVVSLIRP